MRPEIDERSNSFTIRKKRLSVEVGKHLIRNAETVRHHQPTIFLDAPAISYVPADHLLAVCGTTQHEPFKSEHLSTGRQFDFCLTVQPSPIEDDRFLRKPREFRGFTRFQLCRNACSLIH